MVKIIDPILITLVEPIFEIIHPPVGPKIRDDTEKGNWIFAASIAVPPIPKGLGFCIRTGIVWKIEKVQIPHIITTIFVIHTGFLDINFKSTSGKEDLFSTNMKIKSETIDIVQRSINNGEGNSIFELMSPDVLIKVKEDKNVIIAIARKIIPLISSLVTRLERC
jgi:hypothetical protein